MLAEIIPICEYLEEIYPTPALVGSNPEERAETRMWVRRFDLNICEPMGLGFRSSNGMKMFKDRMKLIPSGADELKAMVQDRLTWLDGQMAGKQFVCGERLTLADVYLFCFLDFGNGIGQTLNPDNKNVTAWFERMKQRPSTAA
jgi:glutathione S-transferase